MIFVSQHFFKIFLVNFLLLIQNDWIIIFWIRQILFNQGLKISFVVIFRWKDLVIIWKEHLRINQVWGKIKNGVSSFYRKMSNELWNDFRIYDKIIELRMSSVHYFQELQIWVQRVGKPISHWIFSAQIERVSVVDGNRGLSVFVKACHVPVKVNRGVGFWHYEDSWSDEKQKFVIAA